METKKRRKNDTKKLQLKEYILLGTMAVCLYIVAPGCPAIFS
ncbi:MAG: hypothetical protein PQJ61_06570 [Spirochaetales bacterium]|uniref:Uncharacterized protein n=1 Tax=Candidatus Thalassospirochaeta sargassi TaxID=3119039 RepID=A0AAJ1IFH1_9SPIO|nr:hypothetical protein [Spirochaetales bacterium]